MNMNDIFSLVAFPEMIVTCLSKMRTPVSALTCFSEFVSGKATKEEKKALKASFTVEASIAIPLFFFAVLTIYSYFHMLIVQDDELMSLWEKGRVICVASPIDIVDLREEDSFVPDFNLLNISAIPISVRFYAHAWTGYDLAGQAWEGEEERNVFITKNGSVYHMSKECTHLKLSIETVQESQLGELRNQEGSRYVPCALCGAKRGNTSFYVAKEGDCYHTDLGCSGLKRTIQVIPISKVGSRTRCSRCGGME